MTYIKQCGFCGKGFDPTNMQQKFCSVECTLEAQKFRALCALKKDGGTWGEWFSLEWRKIQADAQRVQRQTTAQKTAMHTRFALLERKYGVKAVLSRAKSVGYLVDNKKGTVALCVGEDMLWIPQQLLEHIATELQGISEGFFQQP